jgi:hypothetical protein
VSEAESGAIFVSEVLVLRPSSHATVALAILATCLTIVAVLFGAGQALADAMDVADMPSVRIGGTCVEKGQRLRDVIRAFEQDREWEFRWDEEMVTKAGLVAMLRSRSGKEPPFLLEFRFVPSKNIIDDAELVRLGWGGKGTEPEAAAVAKRGGCRR